MADSMVSGEDSWWGGWIQAAKEKSMSAIDFVKKDLAEFTTTMQRDTGTAVTVTGSTLKETLQTKHGEAPTDRMKGSITGLFEGLTRALTIPPDDDDQVAIRASDVAASSAIYDRSKVRLHAVQVDPGTYLNTPSGPRQDFETWLDGFTLDSRKGDISHLLVVKVEVRALYTKLVPSELSHAEFWRRYFYKLHQLQQDEARKQALMRRAETPTDDEPIGWEDDWSGGEGEDAEFENITNTEVKVVQEEDAQSRLRPPSENPDPNISSQTPTHNPTTREPVDVLSEKTIADCEQAVIDNVPLENTPTPDKHIPENISKQSESEDQLSTQQVENVTSLEKKQAVVAMVTESRVNADEMYRQEQQPSLSVTGQAEPSLPITSTSGPVAHTSSVQKVTTSIDETDKQTTSTSGMAARGDNLVDITAEVDDQILKAKEKEDNLVALPEADVGDLEVKDKEDDVVVHPVEADDKVLKTTDKGDNLVATLEADGQVKTTEKRDNPVTTVLEPDDHILKTSAKGDNLVASPEADDRVLKVKVKGDLVVVGSDRESSTSESSGNKELSAEDDWEQDFDVELTEEELKAAEELAKKMGTNLDSPDDWENWE